MGSEEVDDILVPNPHRHVLFPIQHQDLWDMYRQALGSFWTAQEVDFSRDLADWEHKLTDDERYYLKHMLSFFAASDGIVGENLAQNLLVQIQYPEARAFYAFQELIETIHAEVYGLFIDTLIKDPDEQKRLFESVERIPCIQKKAQWALHWISSTDVTFAERILAFACVEGIFFSGAFAAIFWLRKRGLMPGLSFANDKIAADEGLHTKFACLIYKNHIKHGKLPLERVLQIVTEAVKIEQEFQSESFSASLIGLNDIHMKQYIAYCGDYLLNLLGYPKHFNSENPFDFMHMISLQPKTNFFETRVAQYQIPLNKKKFSLNMDSIL